MPKRRIYPRGMGSVRVPAELLDFESPLWQSRSSARLWLRDHNLDVTAMTFDAGPANRHWLAVEAWALANGPTREQPYGNHRQVADHEALVAAGVHFAGHSAQLDEIFASAGVKVEA